MATFDDIMTNIANAVPELTNSSQMAIFYKIAQAVAISVDNTKTEIETTKSIIDNIIGLQRYGRSGYYTDKAKAFQYGDSLIEDPVSHESIYATIDTTKQIVKQAAFEAANSGGAQILTLKVAKLDENTNKLAPLDSTEKTSFDSYFTTFEIPGLPVTKVSLPANVFSFTAIVSYYSTYDYNSIITSVNAALYAFRDDYAFDGTLYVNDLETYIKNNVPGIRNISLNNTLIDSVSFLGSIRLSAGYFDFAANIENNLIYVSV